MANRYHVVNRTAAACWPTTITTTVVTSRRTVTAPFHPTTTTTIKTTAKLCRWPYSRNTVQHQQTRKVVKTTTMRLKMRGSWWLARDQQPMRGWRHRPAALPPPMRGWRTEAATRWPQQKVRRRWKNGRHAVADNVGSVTPYVSIILSIGKQNYSKIT